MRLYCKWESLLKQLRTIINTSNSDHLICLSTCLYLKLTRSDLNALVFEYLLIEGFSEAAVEFARETGLPHDIDHELINERMEIREAVEDGRVEEAVRRVNEVDPEVSFLPFPPRCACPRGF